jgi:hypothetical protein
MLRIKVGSFTPTQPEGFEEELREWLLSKGKISDVEGRGLEVIHARHKSAPGSHLMKIGEVLNAAPKHISTRKLLTRLTDMTEDEVRGTVRKMILKEEVEAQPRMAGNYKYFVYALTDKGFEAWEKRVAAYTRGKPVALEIWRVFKTQGFSKGQGVDPKAIRKAMRSTMDNSEFWAGWRTLVSAGRIDVAYNAEGTGKHLYYLAG